MFTKNRIENFLFAISLANLRLIQTWDLLLHKKNQSLDLPDFTPHYYYACLINLVVMTLVFWFFVSLFRRTNKKSFQFLLAIIFLVLLIRPINFLRHEVLLTFDKDLPESVRAVLSIEGGAMLIVVIIFMVIAIFYRRSLFGLLLSLCLTRPIGQN